MFQKGFLQAVRHNLQKAFFNTLKKAAPFLYLFQDRCPH